MNPVENRLAPGPNQDRLVGKIQRDPMPEVAVRPEGNRNVIAEIGLQPTAMEEYRVDADALVIQQSQRFFVALLQGVNVPGKEFVE